MFTMSGIPVLYSGDEIAAENDYSYHDDPLKQEDSRWLHRGDMNWEIAECRKDPDSVEGKLFVSITMMEKMRSDHRAFDEEADTWIVDTNDQSVLGIGRYYHGEKLIGLFNFGSERSVLSIDELGNFSDVFSGERIDKDSIALLPGAFMWVVCDFRKEL